MLESVIPADSRRDNAGPEGQSSRLIVIDAIDARARRPGRNGHDRSLIAGAVVVAVLAHAAIFAVLSRPVESQMGAGGVDLNAISVDVALVPATVLESLAPSQEIAGGAAGILDVADGGQSVPEAPTAKAEEIQGSEPASEPSTAPEPALPRPPREPEDVVRPLIDQPVQQKQPNPTPAVQSAPMGGIAVRAIEDKGATVRGAAAAPPGAIQRYAKSVVEALSRSRPRGVAGSARGTVKIAFAIAEDGSLALVRVAMSSGNPQLDAAALAAVEKVRFPSPPAGMSITQLTYEVPYHFK